MESAASRIETREDRREHHDRADHQPARQLRGFVVHARRLRPFVGDRRGDQALEFRIETVLDLRAEERDRFLTTALLVKQQQPLGRSVDLLEQTRIRSSRSSSTRSSLARPGRQRSDLALAQSPRRFAEPGRHAVTGVVEIHVLGCADQQQLRNLLGVAVGEHL